MKIQYATIFLVLFFILFTKCSKSRNDQDENPENQPVSEEYNQMQKAYEEQYREQEEKKRKWQADSIRMVEEGQRIDDYYEKNFRKIGLDEKIGSFTLEEYLSDKRIPKVFRDVFTQKRALNDDEKTLAMLDSLYSKDNERHPFYFALVTRAMWWSDGAFSEPLGMTAKDYVETNPQQFLTYFRTEKVLTELDFEHWAEYVFGEMCISSDNITADISKTKKLMKKNCIDCTPEDLELLDKFINLLNHYWKKAQEESNLTEN